MPNVSGYDRYYDSCNYQNTTKGQLSGASVSGASASGISASGASAPSSGAACKTASRCIVSEI